MLYKYPVSVRTQNFVVSLKTAYIEACLPNRQLWNVLLYDVMVWISTVAEEDQSLLLHHCLFSPAHQFMQIVHSGPNNKDGSEKNKTLFS